MMLDKNGKNNIVQACETEAENTRQWGLQINEERLKREEERERSLECVYVG